MYNMSLALSQDVILFSSPLSLPYSIIWPQWWAAAPVSAVIHRLAYGDPSLGALGRTKVNAKLFFLCLSLPCLLSLCLFPLHLNQKFLISPVPLGRDLVYVRALRPAWVHRLQSEFLKDEKEKSSETVHRENRKRQRDLYWFELIPLFCLTFLLEHYEEWRDSSASKLISISYTVFLRLPFDSKGFHGLKVDRTESQIPCASFSPINLDCGHTQRLSKYCDIVRLLHFIFSAVNLTSNWQIKTVLMVAVKQHCCHHWQK